MSVLMHNCRVFIKKKRPFVILLYYYQTRTPAMEYGQSQEAIKQAYTIGCAEGFFICLPFAALPFYAIVRGNSTLHMATNTRYVVTESGIVFKDASRGTTSQVNWDDIVSAKPTVAGCCNCNGSVSSEPETGDPSDCCSKHDSLQHEAIAILYSIAAGQSGNTRPSQYHRLIHVNQNSELGVLLQDQFRQRAKPWLPATVTTQPEAQTANKPATVTAQPKAQTISTLKRNAWDVPWEPNPSSSLQYTPPVNAQPRVLFLQNSSGVSQSNIIINSPQPQYPMPHAYYPDTWQPAPFSQNMPYPPPQQQPAAPSSRHGTWDGAIPVPPAAARDRTPTATIDTLTSSQTATSTLVGSFRQDMIRSFNLCLVIAKRTIIPESIDSVEQCRWRYTCSWSCCFSKGGALLRIITDLIHSIYEVSIIMHTRARYL